MKFEESADEMLFSNQVNRFRRNVVILFLVLVVCTAPNVLSHNDQIASNAIDQSKHNASAKKDLPFIEYYIEHNVSQRDAKRSFFEVGIKLLDGACFDNFFFSNHEKNRQRQF